MLGGSVLNETDKRFTGHQQEDSDLIFMRARFYDPYVGRFLAPDSIVPDPMNPQSLNRYSYVNNNPLRYTDPTGYCGFRSWGDVGDCFSDAARCAWNGLNCVTDPLADLARTAGNAAAYAWMMGSDVVAQHAAAAMWVARGALALGSAALDVVQEQAGNAADAIAAAPSTAVDVARTPAGAAAFCAVGGPLGCGLVAAANADRVASFAARFATLDCLGLALDVAGTVALAAARTGIGVPVAAGLFATSAGIDAYQHDLYGVAAGSGAEVTSPLGFAEYSPGLRATAKYATRAAIAYSAIDCARSAL